MAQNARAPATEPHARAHPARSSCSALHVIVSFSESVGQQARPSVCSALCPPDPPASRLLSGAWACAGTRTAGRRRPAAARVRAAGDGVAQQGRAMRTHDTLQLLRAGCLHVNIRAVSLRARRLRLRLRLRPPPAPTHPAFPSRVRPPAQTRAPEGCRQRPRGGAPLASHVGAGACARARVRLSAARRSRREAAVCTHSPAASCGRPVGGRGSPGAPLPGRLCR